MLELDHEQRSTQQHSVRGVACGQRGHVRGLTHPNQPGRSRAAQLSRSHQYDDATTHRPADRHLPPEHRARAHHVGPAQPQPLRCVRVGLELRLRSRFGEPFRADGARGCQVSAPLAAARVAAAYARHLQAPDCRDTLNQLTWAAVARMRADLPPAGPADVEVEVFWMFESEERRNNDTSI